MMLKKTRPASVDFYPPMRVPGLQLVSFGDDGSGFESTPTSAGAAGEGAIGKTDATRRCLPVRARDPHFKPIGISLPL